jgi:hypothetical protein
MPAILSKISLTPHREHLVKVESEFSFLDPVHALVRTSDHLIVSNGFDFRIGGHRFTIPKFLFLGDKGGSAPFEIGIFAGIEPNQTATAQAVANLLVDLEWIPDIAENYVVFAYPVSNPRAYSREPDTAPNLNKLFWQHSAEPEVGYLEKELKRHSFQGIITFHLDEGGSGFYATTPSQVLANEVVQPALHAASKVNPVDSDPLRVLEVSRTGRVAGQPKGRLSAPRNTHLNPFEISLHAPAAASPELQAAGLVIATKTILREYRKFIGHSQHL